jgi:YD repeat-containing protein
MRNLRFFLSIIVLLAALLLGGQSPAGAASPARPQAAGGSVTYTYDAAGRLVRADYGGGKSIIYTYDHAGNLTQRQVTSRALLYLPVILRR